MKKISFGTWAFALGPYADHPVPLEPLLRRLAEVGYEAVELWGLRHHVTLDFYPTTESRSGLRALLDELNLECSGYACDQGGLDPANPQHGDNYMRLLERNLELCRDLAVRDLRVDSGVAPDPRLDDAGREGRLTQAAQRFQAAAEMAQQAGVRLLWEFEPSFQFHRPSEIARLVELVGHPNFYVLFDLSHAYSCAVARAGRQGPEEPLAGGVAELLEMLGPRIGGVHLADAEGEVDAFGGSVHAPFTVGRIDVKGLMPKLNNLPHVNYWTVDLAGWPGSWDLLEAVLAYARRLNAAETTSQTETVS